MTDDYPTSISTTGTVAVGGSATGEIETVGDEDWFAVELVAGRTYRIDLGGSRTGDAPPIDPYLRGIHDADGVLLAGTTDNNGGVRRNSRVTFTADETATYYVAAGAYGLGRGTYELEVTDVTEGVPDDFAAGTGTTGTVAVGGSATGNVETVGDRDWFAVELVAGRTYTIDLRGRSRGGTLQDPYLYGVHDADGDLISGTTDNNGGGRNSYNSRVTFTAGETATYYVAAGAHEGSQLTYPEGTYELEVTDITDVPPDDFAAGTGTTGTVAVGGSTTGDIENYGDRDWFAVELVAGRTYTIDLRGSPTGDGTLFDTYLRGIHDADGDLISGTSDDNGAEHHNSRVTFTATGSGTHYIAVSAHSGLVTYVGTYTLEVTDTTDVPPDDFMAGTGTTGTVAVGGWATGDIEYENDRDWFAVSLEAGRTYRINLEGSRTGAGTLRDPYLYGVHDAEGALLAGTSDDDGGAGKNSRVTFTAGETATYYVAAGAFYDREGTYTLAVRDITDRVRADHLPAGTGTTGTVAVGGSTTGDIEVSGDRDWFAVTLEAGKTYRIDLEGSRTEAGTLFSPYLYGVHDAEGNLVPGTLDYGGVWWRNSPVTFTPEEDGTYYVAAGAHGNLEGTYTLSVTDITDGFQDDHPSGTGTTGTVAVGGSVTGDIEYENDRDWFAVTLEAGRTYRIDLEGLDTGAGTLRDPYLYGVHDADGVLLAGTTNGDSGVRFNSRVTFTAQEDGTYYVAAGAHADGEGTYTLSVRDVTVGPPDDFAVVPVADDFAAGTGTTGTVAVGGSTTGEVETAGDRDWFAVTLEAGRTYRIDIEGSHTGAGTLFNPYLYGVHDADGNLISGTTNDNGGVSRNSRATFTPDADGPYYIAAGAYGSGSGTYTLSVTAPLADLAADTTTTGAVAVGGSAAGEVETAGDHDWFAVTLEAGRTYRIDLEGSPTGGGTLSDPHLYGVHDADGNLISGTTSDDDGRSLNSRLAFTPDAAGTYYIAAGAYRSHVGTYTLSVTSTDLVADTRTTGAVAVGGSAAGEVETAGDHDWFAVTLEAGRTYRIDLEGSWTDAGTLSDPYLHGVHDAEGNLIPGTLDDDGGSVLNSRLAFTPDAAGTYYIAAGARRSGSGTYTLSVTEESVAEEPVVPPPVNEEPVPGESADLAADTTTTGAVAVGGSAAGEVDTAGDHDWFAVTLEAGRTYRIDLEGSPTGDGTLSDPYLRGVYDADGNLVPGTLDDDGGQSLNSRVAFTPDEAGTYYIAAGAYGSGSGTYTLSVTEELASAPQVTEEPVAGESADLAADTTTTGAVAVGGSAAGEVDTAGDHDWFAVTLEAGRTYRIDLKGLRTEDGTLDDPYLRGVHDAAGNLISGTLDDDGGWSLNSRLAFTPDAAGTYYVAAGAYGSGSGTYTLSVTEEPASAPPVTEEPVAGESADLAADTTTTGAVAVGGSAAGEIDTAGDHDWFAVTLEAGRTYRIDLKGSRTEDGTLDDPYLRGVHDADGNLISGTLDDDGGWSLNSRLAFTPDAAGTYYVAAGAYGSDSGTYTLSVEDGL